MSFYEMEFSPVVALPKWQVLDRVSKRFLPLIIWLNCSVPKAPQDDCFLDRLDFTSEHDVLHTTRADLVHLSIMWCMDTDRIRKMRIKWVKRNSEFKNWNVTLKCENDYRENLKELYFLQRTLPCRDTNPKPEQQSS